MGHLFCYSRQRNSVCPQRFLLCYTPDCLADVTEGVLSILDQCCSTDQYAEGQYIIKVIPVSYTKLNVHDSEVGCVKRYVIEEGGFESCKMTIGSRELPIDRAQAILILGKTPDAPN